MIAHPFIRADMRIADGQIKDIGLRDQRDPGRMPSGHTNTVQPVPACGFSTCPIRTCSICVTGISVYVFTVPSPSACEARFSWFVSLYHIFRAFSRLLTRRGIETFNECGMISSIRGFPSSSEAQAVYKRKLIHAESIQRIYQQF